MLMKLVALLLIITFALILGCGTSDPLVGRWKPVQRYDRFKETWEPAGDGVLFLQLSGDGKFSGFVRGERAGGTYTVDTTVTPHHLILNDANSGTINVVYKIEGNSMTWKSYLDTGATFPQNLEPGNDEPSFELVKIERQP
jgi:hypothetical protein